MRQRLVAAGGSVGFDTYMGWVLHDPDWGAYGSGRLQIGPGGDFVTSPSLGPDFAALLAPQLIAWLRQIAPAGTGRLSLVEAGPGEGALALDLSRALQQAAPELADRLEIVLVEPNPGMEARQRQHLRPCPLPVRWCSFEALAEAPVQGVLLAHEVLDALPVQRVQRHGEHWCEQRVALVGERLELVPGERLGERTEGQLAALGLHPKDPQRGEGWCSELHPGLAPWLGQAAAAFSRGRLLVIDYALEAWRYYAPQRSRGTLMAYRQQVASSDPLLEPGAWDLTAHLCIDSLVIEAEASGWQLIGARRQGEALLALGLAQRLHGLQGEDHLEAVLPRREALLRLVDPAALGEFRWIAFERRTETTSLQDQPVAASGASGKGAGPSDLFLLDPPLA